MEGFEGSQARGRRFRTVARRIGSLRKPVVLALAASIALRPTSLSGVAYAKSAMVQRDVRDTLSPPRITLGPHGRDVRLAGGLADGTARRLAAVLTAHPRIARIHLTSEGGLVDEGTAIGAVVAAHRLATYVPDYCVSACTLIFVRGGKRYLRIGGRLGFHAPYEIGRFGKLIPVDATPERGAYAAAGVGSDFLSRALAVAPTDIWIPHAAELIRGGVVTQIVDASRFPDSTLDDDDSALAARAAVTRMFPALRSMRASDLHRTATWYRDGYHTGRPEGTAISELRRWATVPAGSASGLSADGTRLWGPLRSAAPKVEATGNSVKRSCGIRSC